MAYGARWSQTPPAFWNARASSGLWASSSNFQFVGLGFAPAAPVVESPTPGRRQRFDVPLAQFAGARTVVGRASSHTVSSRVSKVNVAVAAALHPGRAH